MEAGESVGFVAWRKMGCCPSFSNPTPGSLPARNTPTGLAGTRLMMCVALSVVDKKRLVAKRVGVGSLIGRIERIPIVDTQHHGWV